MRKIFTGGGQITPYRPWPEERKAQARLIAALKAARARPTKRSVAAVIAAKVDCDLLKMWRLAAYFGLDAKLAPPHGYGQTGGSCDK